MTYKFVFSILIISFLFSCKKESTSQEVKEPQLGKVSLEVQGIPEAVEKFEKGLLLLHSFEYKDARAAFQESSALDSTLVMAYWGEAMTYNHSLWQRQETDEAISTLHRLGSTPEERISKCKSELEKDFIKSLDVLFGHLGASTKYERDVAYEKYMSEMESKYPNNNEVKAFHAISLLAASRNGRNQELYDKCANIAKGIIKENPNHPGALHYLIHAYDDPNHAHMAKAAADSYSKVAPDATHALHMPSHIYVALGLWDDVVNSNVASWNASVKTEKESFHALNWLQYGLLQKNKFKESEELLNRLITFYNDSATKNVRSYLIAMLGAQMVESENWETENWIPELKTDDLNIVKRSGYNYLIGMRAFHTKDTKTLNDCIDNISKDHYNASLNLGEKTFAMCSTAGFANKPPDQLDIDMVSIILSELQAKKELNDGKINKAISILQKASDLDMTLSYSYGPPAILKPVHEDLAELFLHAKKYEEAIKMFDRSLTKNPNRLISLKGKLKAAKQLKLNEIVMETEQIIEECLTENQTKNIL